MSPALTPARKAVGAELYLPDSLQYTEKNDGTH
jgi:hypothetical protein